MQKQWTCDSHERFMSAWGSHEMVYCCHLPLSPSKPLLVNSQPPPSRAALQSKKSLVTVMSSSNCSFNLMLSMYRSPLHGYLANSSVSLRHWPPEVSHREAVRTSIKHLLLHCMKKYVAPDNFLCYAFNYVSVV